MSASKATELSVVAFAGSLRSGSYNRSLLRNAARNAPDRMKLSELKISDLPFFDADVESAGDPSSVKRLKDAVRAADGLIVFTPEYNGSVSAVTKNAIDWLSRRTGGSGSAIAGKPVAIGSATPGGRGGPGARADLARIIGFMTDGVFEETFALPKVSEHIDGNGALSRPAAEQLAGWLKRFNEHITMLRQNHDAA